MHQTIRRRRNSRAYGIITALSVVVLVLALTFIFSIYQNRHMPTGSIQSNYFLDYVVKPGETLSQIATDHQTSVQAIMHANPTVTLTKNIINAGSHILIPIKEIID